MIGVTPGSTAPLSGTLVGMHGKEIADTMMLMDTFGGPSSTAIASTNGFLLGGWWYLPKPVTIDRLGYRIGSGVTGSVGALIRLGIYATNTLGVPVGAPVAEIDGLSGSAAINTNVSAALAASVSLQPGWYCPVLELQGSPAVVTPIVGFLSSFMPGFIPIATGTTPFGIAAWFAAGSATTSTPLPTDPTPVYTGAGRPWIWAHILSVP